MKGKVIILQEKETPRNHMFSMLINLDPNNDTAEELFLQRKTLSQQRIQLRLVSVTRLTNPHHTVIGVFNVFNK